MSTDLAIFGGEPIRKEPFPAWPRITEEMKQSLIHTFEEEEWGVGSKTITLFNEQFATMQDAKYCLSIHSGTSAIWICLKAAGIEAGDEVILPSYTFIATATAVVLANAVPVFADIDKKTANLDPTSVEKLITKKTKAIIPVHTAGAPADMKAFLDISKKYNIPIIEDAAQGHGSSVDNRKVGAIGLGGIFSFQTSKNMSSGEGGAIVSNDESFIDACFSYHNCGRVRNGKWYEHFRLGSNMRMSALNAAVLLPQIKSVENDFILREQNRQYLDSQIGGIDGFVPMDLIPGSRSSNHLYMVRYLKEEFNNISRELFFKAMQAEGVFTYKGWSPLYKEPLFSINPKEYPWLEGRNYGDLFHSGTEIIAEEQAVWLRQNHLLGSSDDLKDVVDAFEKVSNALKKNPKKFDEIKL